MVQAGAKFSTNRIYRYALWRPVPLTHEVSVRNCVFIGLNPSIADETTDDPTVRRCWGFALREGCGVMTLINLFAIKATDSAEMRMMLNPVGPGNDRAIIHYVTKNPIEPVVIACWGIHGGFRNRDKEVMALLKAEAPDLPIQCFGRSAEGYPRHPLFLPANTPLEPFTEV